MVSPPKDINLERSVITGIINREHLIDQARGILDAECFTDQSLRDIWLAIETVDNRGDEVDALGVYNAMVKAGRNTSALMQLIGSAAPLTIASSAEVLAGYRVAREVWRIALNLQRDAASPTVDVAESISRGINELTAASTLHAECDTPLSAAVGALTEHVRVNRSPQGAERFSPSGFPQFDAKGVLAPGSLIVVAAESSQGKTAFATAIALESATHGHPVAFYSMEMTSLELTARMASMKSGINASDILNTPLSAGQVRQLDEALLSLPTANIFFDDNSTSSLTDILASIRSMVLKHGIRGAVVDYLQILNINESAGRGLNAEQTMALAARRLKNAAKQLGIWIIAVSQLSRDQMNPQPTIRRLRDSGQIAEAADNVVLIYRPQVYGRSYPDDFKGIDTHGTAMVDVAKGRNTGTFRFICGFRPEQTLFYPLGESQLPQVVKTNTSFDTSMPF